MVVLVSVAVIVAVIVEVSVGVCEGVAVIVALGVKEGNNRNPLPLFTESNAPAAITSNKMKRKQIIRNDLLFTFISQPLSVSPVLPEKFCEELRQS